jgi:hypothetical protein
VMAPFPMDGSMMVSSIDRVIVSCTAEGES